MFSIGEILSGLLSNLQNFFNLIIGFFDMILQAFEAVKVLWDISGKILSYCPGEVSAVVFTATIGYVGAFVMW